MSLSSGGAARDSRRPRGFASPRSIGLRRTPVNGRRFRAPTTLSHEVGSKKIIAQASIGSAAGPLAAVLRPRHPDQVYFLIGAYRTPGPALPFFVYEYHACGF